MARTFSYQKNRCNHKQPRTRSTWGKPTTTIKRGKYADIADRVHQHRISITDKSKEKQNAKIDL